MATTYRTTVIDDRRVHAACKMDPDMPADVWQESAYCLDAPAHIPTGGHVIYVWAGVRHVAPETVSRD